MKQNKSTVHALVIIAHPDDESFLMSGTSLKFAHEGKNVGIICATCGEKGDSRLKQPVSPKQLGETRQKELKACCRLLKIKHLKFLYYQDGGLINADFKKLVSRLRLLIERIQPEIVLTFGTEGISGHNDHIVIGKAAVAASKQAKPRVAEIWRASMPTSFIKTFNEYLLKIRVHHAHFKPKPLKGVPDKRLLKINIQKYRNKKLQALDCHKSQGLPPWMIYNFSGIKNSFLNYEFFEIIKLKQSA